MSFDIEGAKKAGYSDTEIQSFLQKTPSTSTKSFDAEAAKEAGYSDKEIQTFLNKNGISKARSLISAPIKGLIKGAEDISGLADPSTIIMNQLLPKKQSLLGQITEKVLPTQEGAAEGFLERAGRIAPTAALGGGNLVRNLLLSGSGAALGELAKQEGVGELGQSLAEIAGMSVPGITSGVAKGAKSLLKSPAEKLASGLTKPRAVEAKFAEKAIMSPARQEKAISNLNKEASSLAEKTLQKEVPLVDQIRKGVDFESQFEHRFGELQKIAEKANPEIDISPLSKFMSQSTSKYRGIPKLHSEAAKVKSEIRAFSSKPPIDLKSGLRTYRSNNKKIKNIYETSRITGSQEEYVDFLLDYNRNLAKSFSNTLPHDSAWIKEFNVLNKEYRGYKDALKTMHHLKPILGSNPTPASIKKLATDPKLQKKLELSMGKKGSEEIIQLSKDLELATESIKKIPARELKAWDLILPLSIFVPGVHIPGSIVTAKKAFDFSRRGYGFFLSTPERKKSYYQALKAINTGNKALYIKSAKELNNSLNQESSESSS